MTRFFGVAAETLVLVFQKRMTKPITLQLLTAAI
jgi:hypothetical protein